jgi:hypothetical protein
MKKRIEIYQFKLSQKISGKGSILFGLGRPGSFFLREGFVRRGRTPQDGQGQVSQQDRTRHALACTDVQEG